jgi:hypothetical protein
MTVSIVPIILLIRLEQLLFQLRQRAARSARHPALNAFGDVIKHLTFAAFSSKA